MKTFKITISTFFFVCLFNVAFIPQLCLDVIEDFQNHEVVNSTLGEESANSLNIFEEESKESSNENNESENNSLTLKSLGLIYASVHNVLLKSLVSNIFHSNLYQSIPILKITPPPKV